jgi:hypothetical protein
MDVYRWTENVVNGVTKNSESQIAYGIKCHYSGGSLTDTGDQGSPDLVNSHKLFCSSSADIKEGDRVVITQRNGNTISLSVGEGFVYSGKFEFSVKRSDKA